MHWTPKIYPQTRKKEVTGAANQCFASGKAQQHSVQLAEELDRNILSCTIWTTSAQETILELISCFKASL